MTITNEQLNQLVETTVYSTAMSLLIVWVIASFLVPVAIHFLDKKLEERKK